VEVEGAVAVVTGGASGIGRALALALADAGAAAVVVVDLDGAGAEAVARQIGGHARGVACDVADDDQVGGLIEAAEEERGQIGRPHPAHSHHGHVDQRVAAAQFHEYPHAADRQAGSQQEQRLRAGPALAPGRG